MADPAVMADHFEKIQKLPDPIPGCPNFRRVPGYKVYCCGQPTDEGFEKALEKVTASYPKDGKIIWFNLRQEPVVYVNGQPLCARPSNKIGEYAELGNVTRDMVKEQEVAFLKTCKARAEENGGKLKFVDINKKESEIEVKDIKTLSAHVEKLKEKFPGLVHMRVPVCNSGAPLETDYDIIVNTMVGSSINTPIIVNDQVKSLNSLEISCFYSVLTNFSPRSVSPAPPPAVCPPACSRNSRSPPPSRASSRPCPALTCPCSRWTGTP